MKKIVFFLVVLVLATSIALVACNKTKVFELTQEALTIAVGDTAKLPVKIEGYDDVTITSSDTNVVTVDGEYITGVDYGEATVNITADGVTLSVAVTVIISYNQNYLQVTFSIPAPANNTDVSDFSKVISKKYYTSVTQNKDGSASSDVPNPAIPNGYAFSGWCINQDCTVKATFPYELTTNNVNFYGKWIIRDGTQENDPNIQLKYTDLNPSEKTATIQGFLYPSVPYETIVIPSTATIDNVQYTVTKIADGAFCDHKYLKTVYMPSIANIGDEAFKNCTSLNTVTIDHLVLKSVGKQAFFDSGLEYFKSTKVASDADWVIESFGTDAFYNTKYIDTKTRAISHVTFPGEDSATILYHGYLHGDTLVAYDYEHLSNTMYYSPGYAGAITFYNYPITKIACTFPPEHNVKIILLGYDTPTAEDLKNKFVAAGIKEENVEIR